MRVIDSHTAGEPTRVILDGGPDLGSGTLADRADALDRNHRDFCSAVLREPRGYVAMVGALLVEPEDPDCAAGVLYFNTAGTLGMCGHATIGLAVTLNHLGRIAPGTHRFETPVGVVAVNLEAKNTVAVTNVESYRTARSHSVDVSGYGIVTGDVAWGGNWFFLVKESPIPLTVDNIGRLTDFTLAIRAALAAQPDVGNSSLVDHIEVFGAPQNAGADSRNFVMCPDGAYDRSPCGTGSSAKLACLAEDGILLPGSTWVQESIIGSTYRLSYRPGQRGIVPTITGEAHVTAEATLIFGQDDPYRDGIPI